MKLVITLMTLSLFAYGCSGGGRGRIGAKFCTTDHDPVKFEVAGASSKINLDTSSALELSEGTYELASTELYVNDTEKGIRLHVSATIKDGKTEDTNLVCVGTNDAKAIVNNMPLDYKIDAISRIIVDGTGAAQKTTLGGGVLSIDVRDRGPGVAKLETDFQLDDSKTAQKSLKNTYTGYTNKEQYLFKVNDTYLLQNKLKDADNVKVQSIQTWKLVN